MSENQLKDKTVEPNDQILESFIGNTMPFFLELRSFLNDNYTPITEQWKHYGQKIGWNLKMFHKKRNLLFLVAYSGYFMVGIVFGDKAVQAIEQSDLPEPLIESLVNSRKYMEGRGLSIDVKSQADLEIVKKLLRFKVG